MQYAIMKQHIPGSNDVWHAVCETVDGELISLVYTSQEEAASKLVELQTNEPTTAQYKIESYQDNPEV
jgi:hypothetical protein